MSLVHVCTNCGHAVKTRANQNEMWARQRPLNKMPFQTALKTKSTVEESAKHIKFSIAIRRIYVAIVYITVCNSVNGKV